MDRTIEEICAMKTRDLMHQLGLPNGNSIYAALLEAYRSDPLTGNWIAAGDVDRLTKELERHLYGEEAKAERPKLCDLVAAVKRTRWVRFYPFKEGHRRLDPKDTMFAVDVSCTNVMPGPLTVLSTSTCGGLVDIPGLGLSMAIRADPEREL